MHEGEAGLIDPALGPQCDAGEEDLGGEYALRRGIRGRQRQHGNLVRHGGGGGGEVERVAVRGVRDEADEGGACFDGGQGRRWRGCRGGGRS